MVEQPSNNIDLQRAINTVPSFTLNPDNTQKEILKKYLYNPIVVKITYINLKGDRPYMHPLRYTVGLFMNQFARLSSIDHKIELINYIDFATMESGSVENFPTQGSNQIIEYEGDLNIVRSSNEPPRGKDYGNFLYYFRLINDHSVNT